MNQVRGFLASASAEIRSARRLVRTWLFILLSLGISLFSFGALTVMHSLVSQFSPSFPFLNPRFMAASVGYNAVIGFLIALVFLAFDIRARDQRDRMAEVLDARSVGNVAVLAGRLAGLVLALWLTMAVVMLLLQGFGLLARAMELPFGDLIEPWSLAALLLIDAPPTLLFWGALVVLLAVTLRNRLVVAVAALGLLGLYMWLIYGLLPFYLFRPFAGFTAFTGTPSDLAPDFAEPADLVQRLGVLLLAAALLVCAAAVHPRRDQPVARQLLVSIVLGAGGAALIGGVAWHAIGQMQRQDAWAAAHEAAQGEARADVEEVRGQVRIAPGDALRVDLEYRLAAPPAGLQRLVFTLNPGMSIASLTVDGQDAAFTHENGLLDIPLPVRLAGGASAAVSIAASGVPDPLFGYLDSAVDIRRQRATATVLQIYGSESSVFDERYVALMPGAAWLPTAGADFGRESPARYGRDYFSVDLEVSVPQDWLVAGPGLREGEDGRFRFRPRAPVPEVALLASSFERRTLPAAGVELELLISPKHLRNVLFFEDSAESIAEYLEERFAAAEDMGLAYPYGAFSLVEVPARLRGYGGGWRMAAAQTAPGMAMLRESAFPTARFDLATRMRDIPDGDSERARRAMARVLLQFFGNDLSGGNPLYGGAQSFLGYQTGAEGEGAIALDAVVHELALRLLTDAGGGFFSAHSFVGTGFQGMMGESFARMFGGGAASLAQDAMNVATNRPSVWDSALGTPLAGLDPAPDPELALNVLWLKAPVIAESLVRALGREAVATLLAELRRRYAGRRFTAQDFAAVAADTGVDLAAVVGDWLHDAALPGLLVAAPEVYRLEDDEQGRPRYQIRVHVRNDEPAPGVAHLRVQHGELTVNGRPTPVAAESAVEFGMVLPEPPAEAWIVPALALNRDRIRLALPDADQSETVAEEPLIGTRASTWAPPPERGIVVDDLSPGFATSLTRLTRSSDGVRLAGTSRLPDGVDIDQGLPVYGILTFQSPVWTRHALPGTWGKYRRTMARIPAGDGNATGVFTAELPTSGRWRLAYHLPDMRGADNPFGFGGRRGATNEGLGTYDLELIAGEAHPEVEFDASSATVGWNDLGEFVLPAGEATLTVSSRTNGRVVVADAIRWRAVDDSVRE